ncbi:unnamed protein product [Protopolystoma xenopodis]|uniref:Uncharacterized protein n=1 Tax=Protopolystoma xenopodis TaxID=117903 RepID=A0A448WNA9_9PLAT|nr:unnamed protein product [Protopolystoma xenopodis]
MQYDTSRRQTIEEREAERQASSRYLLGLQASLVTAKARTTANTSASLATNATPILASATTISAPSSPALLVLPPISMGPQTGLARPQLGEPFDAHLPMPLQTSALSLTSPPSAPFFPHSSSLPPPTPSPPPPPPPSSPLLQTAPSTQPPSAGLLPSLIFAPTLPTPASVRSLHLPGSPQPVGESSLSSSGLAELMARLTGSSLSGHELAASLAACFTCLQAQTSCPTDETTAGVESASTAFCPASWPSQPAGPQLCNGTCETAHLPQLDKSCSSQLMFIRRLLAHSGGVGDPGPRTQTVKLLPPSIGSHSSNRSSPQDNHSPDYGQDQWYTAPHTHTSSGFSKLSTPASLPVQKSAAPHSSMATMPATQSPDFLPHSAYLCPDLPISLFTSTAAALQQQQQSHRQYQQQPQHGQDPESTESFRLQQAMQSRLDDVIRLSDVSAGNIDVEFELPQTMNHQKSNAFLVMSPSQLASFAHLTPAQSLQS